VNEKPKVVIDTNVCVRATISSSGGAAKIRELWKGNKFSLVVAPEIVTEIERVFTYSYLQKFFRKDPKAPKEFIVELLNKAKVVDISETKLNFSLRDKDDEKFLKCAKISKAFYLISEDIHLLEVKNKCNFVKIVDIKMFLENFKI